MKRQRLGLIVPSSNTVMEADFYRRLPENVTLHTARMYLVSTTKEGEDQMLDVYFPAALRDLVSLCPQTVVFGCTSAGALRGLDYDDRLCGQIRHQAGCPAISVIASVRQRLLAAEVRRVLLLTPYVEELTERVRDSLISSNVSVCRWAGLGIRDNFAIASVPGEEICRFVRTQLVGSGADAVFLSCTNFPAMAVRQQLEAELSLPVFTSNQVALEAALAALV